LAFGDLSKELRDAIITTSPPQYGKAVELLRKKERDHTLGKLPKNQQDLLDTLEELDEMQSAVNEKHDEMKERFFDFESQERRLSKYN